MSASLMIIIVLGAALSIANVIVCIGVLRSSSYSGTQMIAQCAVTWLVPVFGTILVWGVLRSQTAKLAVADGVYPQQDQGVSGSDFGHPDVSAEEL